MLTVCLQVCVCARARTYVCMCACIQVFKVWQLKVVKKLVNAVTANTVVAGLPLRIIFLLAKP